MLLEEHSRGVGLIDCFMILLLTSDVRATGLGAVSHQSAGNWWRDGGGASDGKQETGASEHSS